MHGRADRLRPVRRNGHASLLRARSPYFILAFAGACALGSIYGFMQGAWPFGVVEAIWAVVALRRWQKSNPASAIFKSGH